MEDYKKRLDEVLASVKQLAENNPHDEGIQNWVQDNFPELEESEDERIRKVLVGWIKCEPLSSFEKGFSQEQILAWLEKQGEQKPAWSEEDERRYRGLHNLIYSTQYCDSRKELSDWLKSLKDRYTWKPSDEQMNAFDAVLVYNPPFSNECRNHLITLYNDLKKLMEE